MLKSLGGDRLGSGNKMQVALHNYERSTHNLSYIWRSTMAPGTLVPFCKMLALNGDTFTIDTKTLIRTMPAIGPLFGSYKLQLDFFECPIRLYNGILHNNMTKIGMDMAQVKLPKIEVKQTLWNTLQMSSDPKLQEMSTSSLMRYMGITGIGGVKFNPGDRSYTIKRKFNAVPILAYYDIFKNYYANKQEENAYVIYNTITEEPYKGNVKTNFTNTEEGWTEDTRVQNDYDTDQGILTTSFKVVTQEESDNGYYSGIFVGSDINGTISPQKQPDIEIDYNFTFAKSEQGDVLYTNSPILNLAIVNDGNEAGIPIDIKLQDPTENQHFYKMTIEGNTIKLTFDTTQLSSLFNTYLPNPTEDVKYAMYITDVQVLPMYPDVKTEIQLQEFPLDNIDEMRIWLLQNTQLGTENVLNRKNILPYNVNYYSENTFQANHFPMNGLVVKTYQSDIFNNWLSSEWVDGVKGINTITAVSTAGDEFTIDALNLANKVYNMLNRIAVSGGTYEDWQEAVYGEDAIRRAESPIYCGGASGMIAFEEIISTADTETKAAGDQPLGSLAGKGTCVDYKGGEIDIHIKEPSYIIGIASITPLIDYCQGNDFDMTELDSINDLHKPALDGIGFQDLILEQAAYWTSYFDTADEGQDTGKLYKQAGGKLPAWLNYMTNYNKVFGEFAEKEKLGFMVLTRDYEEGDSFYNGSVVDYNSQGSQKTIRIKDWTTYINPTKFNYQFADTSLTAQNFWVQIGCNIIARRKMSAKIIPNL